MSDLDLDLVITALYYLRQKTIDLEYIPENIDLDGFLERIDSSIDGLNSVLSENDPDYTDYERTVDLLTGEDFDYPNP